MLLNAFEVESIVCVLTVLPIISRVSARGKVFKAACISGWDSNMGIYHF